MSSVNGTCFTQGQGSASIEDKLKQMHYFLVEYLQGSVDKDYLQGIVEE